jgi:hypothetical protein
MCQVDKSDLLKILDILKANESFHRYRDFMNASIHLATETRFSPLTSETISARERLEKILEGTQDV